MNKQLTQVSIAFGGIFLLLFLNLTNLQVFDASGLNNRADNKRSLYQQYDVDQYYVPPTYSYGMEQSGINRNPSISR